MSALSLFNFNGHDVRVAMLDGTHWWVAVDVCRALGMELYSGTTQWLRGLRSDERQRVGRSDLPEIFSGISAGSMTIITESGLYKLIMRSSKPEARAFQDWVTRVVLPAIRKDGAYIMGEEKVATGEASAEDERGVAWLPIIRRGKAAHADAAGAPPPAPPAPASGPPHGR